MFRRILLLFTILISQQTFSKILIFTYSYNRPDFIEIQYRTLQKFLIERDYKLIVFNDARDQSMVRHIENMCASYGIQCIRIPQEIHNRPYLQRWPTENYNHPTVRNCNVVQYSLDILGFDHDDILILFDSDLFLVKPFSIREFLKDCDLGGRLLARGSRRETGDSITYLWHGLAFLNMATMPNKRSLNFNCGRVDNKPVDAGGHSHYYLRNNPTLKTSFIKNYNFSDELQCNNCQRTNQLICTHNSNELKNLSFDENQIQFLQLAHNVEFFHNNSFLHYRCGSNWDNKNYEYHQKKSAALMNYINKILQ